MCMRAFWKVSAFKGAYFEAKAGSGLLVGTDIYRAMVHGTCGPQRGWARCQLKLGLSPSMSWASLPPQGSFSLLKKTKKNNLFALRGFTHLSN